MHSSWTRYFLSKETPWPAQMPPSRCLHHERTINFPNWAHDYAVHHERISSKAKTMASSNATKPMLETVAMPSMLLHLHHAWMHSGIPINQRRTDTYAALNKWDFRIHFCMIQMQHHRLRYHRAIYLFTVIIADSP